MKSTARTMPSRLREPVQTESQRLTRLVAGALVAAAVGILFAAAVARAEKGEVTMGTAVEVPTDDGVLYRVSYEYDFPLRDSVYIDGVGTVSAQGQLNYLNSGESIRILDKFGGQTLHTVTIEDPIRLMGGDSADLPRESDFPEAYRQGRWSGTRPFADVTLAVLDRFFPNGYRAYRRTDRQHFLTMFATLPPVSERVRAQVAVLVSLPVDANPRDLAFTLQFSARERRSHSEWRRELADNTQGAVHAFVTQVLTALENGR